MSWRHNGRNLWTMPGETPDGMLTVWRGFRPDQYDPRTGMPSSDLLARKYDAITRLIQAINADDEEYVCRQIEAHTHNHHLGDITTPFVSVARTERTARNYSRRPSEMIGELVVHHTRVIPGGMWSHTELLVLGGVTPDEIEKIDFGMPPPSPFAPEAPSDQVSVIQMLRLEAS